MTTPRAQRRRNRWLLAGIVLLVLSVWYTNINQTLNTRTGCKRGVASYRVNADNWRVAQQARQQAFDDTHKSFDGMAARRYGLNAAQLEKLAETDCSAAYPLPFPLHL